jgi:hypothetical protein
VTLPSEPHIEHCPGCVADRLIEADREHLRSTGWTDPQHVLAPKPQMAPPEKLWSTDQKTGFIGVVVLSWAISVATHPTGTLVITALAVALAGAWFALHRAGHQTQTRGCPFCHCARFRAARREWAAYRQLMEKDRSRRKGEAHAANYARLRELEVEQARIREQMRRDIGLS